MHYIVAVVSLLFCTAIPARDTNCNANGNTLGTSLKRRIGNTGLSLTLTSNVTGRQACLSEVVTFTCTARGHILFWGNEEFGEITVHYLSPPSGGEFQAAVESYENNCLVSTLTLRATASRNRTRVVCTNRDRSLSEPLSLNITLSCMATSQRCSDCTEPPSFPFSNQTNCTESPTNSTPPITLYVITAVISGVVAFCSGILFAGVCNCILQCHEQWRVDRKSSKCTTGVATQERGGSPEYEEIPTPESGSQSDIQFQHNAAYVAVQSSH